MGAYSSRPGWMVMAAPVARCATAAACSTLTSFGCSGHEQPISPMMPARTPVDVRCAAATPDDGDASSIEAPDTMSSMSISAIWSTLHSSIAAG